MNLEKIRFRLILSLKLLILLFFVAVISIATIKATRAISEWKKAENLVQNSERLNLELILAESDLELVKRMEFDMTKKIRKAEIELEELRNYEKKYTKDVKDLAKITVEQLICKKAIADGRLAVFDGDTQIQAKIIAKANKFCAAEDVPEFLKKEVVVKMKTVYVDPYEYGAELIEGFDQQEEYYSEY